MHSSGFDPKVLKERRLHQKTSGQQSQRPMCSSRDVTTYMDIICRESEGGNSPTHSVAVGDFQRVGEGTRAIRNKPQA
jgi:hypothetical protein